MRFYLSSLILLLSHLAWAQNPLDSAKVKFGEVPVIFGNLARPYLSVDYEIDAGSRDWSSQEMLDFFYGGFLNHELKSGLLRSVDEELSLGFQNSWQLNFVYQGHKKVKLLPIPKRSIYFYNRSYSSLNLSRDLVELALFGNKLRAGERFNDLTMNYESWFYSGLGFQFGLLVDTIPISLGLSLVGVHSFQGADASINELYTALNGSSIQFDGRYKYDQSSGTSTLALNGLGFALSLATEEQRANHRLRISLDDLGLAYLSDLQRISRDSSFTFNGFAIPRLLSAEDPFIEEQGDSISGALVGAKKAEEWRLLPFRLALDYGYTFSKSGRHGMGLRFNYLYLQAYFPKTSLYYQYRVKDLRLAGGLAYGGFREWSLDLNLDWSFAKYWRLNFNLQNVAGLFFLQEFQGAGAYAAIRYYL